jgi:hypothetical protein
MVTESLVVAVWYLPFHCLPPRDIQMHVIFLFSDNGRGTIFVIQHYVKVLKAIFYYYLILVCGV